MLWSKYFKPKRLCLSWGQHCAAGKISKKRMKSKLTRNEKKGSSKTRTRTRATCANWRWMERCSAWTQSRLIVCEIAAVRGRIVEIVVWYSTHTANKALLATDLKQRHHSQKKVEFTRCCGIDFSFLKRSGTYHRNAACWRWPRKPTWTKVDLSWIHSAVGKVVIFVWSLRIPECRTHPSLKQYLGNNMAIACPRLLKQSWQQNWLSELTWTANCEKLRRNAHEQRTCFLLKPAFL